MKKWLQLSAIVLIIGSSIGLFVVHQGKASPMPNLASPSVQNGEISTARDNYVVQAVKNLMDPTVKTLFGAT